MLRYIAVIFLACCASASAHAQAGPGSGAVAQANAPWATLDSNNAAFQGVIAITPGTPVTATRSLGFLCTVAGNVTLTLADTSTITVGLVTSTTLQTLPFAVTNVALGTGTAGSFWGLK